MTDDKLREAAKEVMRVVDDYSEIGVEEEFIPEGLLETIAELRAALADTADAPPEVTGEMVEAFEEAHWVARHEYRRRVRGGRGRPYLDAAERAGVMAGLRAALAAAHKEGK